MQQEPYFSFDITDKNNPNPNNQKTEQNNGHGRHRFINDGKLCQLIGQKYSMNFKY